MVRFIKCIALMLPLSLAYAGDQTAGGTTHLRLAQAAYSPKCATSVGICFVNPQPIGSACACGSYPGQIIP